MRSGRPSGNAGSRPEDRICRHGMLEWWTRGAGMVDTACWNGGHGGWGLRWRHRRPQPKATAGLLPDVEVPAAGDFVALEALVVLEVDAPVADVVAAGFVVVEVGAFLGGRGRRDDQAGGIAVGQRLRRDLADL